MKIVKPRSVISGFHATFAGDERPELLHLGEQWVPHEFAIQRHQHSVWELYLQLDGWSEWHDARGGRYRCKAGAILAMPPRLEHWLSASSQGQHHFYYAGIDVSAIVQRRLANLSAAWSSRVVVHRAGGESCRDSFRQLIREATIDAEFRDAALRIAVDRLILDVSRLHVAKKSSHHSLLPLDPTIEAARDALDTHPAEPWTLMDLGRLAGVSANHLAARFKRAVGQSPHQYLSRRRIEMAIDLLRNTDTSVTTISLELGFNSSQHFARAFRQITGLTATACRNGKRVQLRPLNRGAGGTEARPPRSDRTPRRRDPSSAEQTRSGGRRG